MGRQSLFICLILLLIPQVVCAEFTYKLRNNPQTGRGDWITDPQSIQDAIDAGGTGNVGIGTYKATAKYLSDGTTVGASTIMYDTGANIGIGTSLPTKKLEVKNGDLYINNASSNIYLKSPNGTCYFLAVDNSGLLTMNSGSCP